MRMLREDGAAAAILAVWLAVACCRLDLPGLQLDEVLYAAWLYPDQPAGWVDRLMLMPYMGALKAWIYAPWIASAGGSAWAARLPMVLASAATLGLIYLLLRKLFPGWCAPALLAPAAADPLYLLTSRYDWGPVVLQRLCFWGAVAVLAGGWTARRVFWAGLLCGVGLFDKLSFHWLLLAGLGAVLAVFPRQTLRRLRFAPAALGGFALGSLPLWIFRLSKGGGDAIALEGSWAPISAKLSLVRHALAGRPLNGWLAHSYLEPEIIERFSPPAWLALADHGAGTWLLLTTAAAAAALSLPAVRRTAQGRWALAGAIFCMLSWGQMIVLQGAGYVHHQALTAPVPQLAVGLVGLELWRRGRGQRLLPAGMALMLAAQSVALARQFKEILDYGGRPTWSEAIYPLASLLEQHAPERVLALDWGIALPLRLLSAGRLPVRGVYTDEDLRNWLLSTENRLFVEYAPGVPDLFEGAQPKLERLAAEIGLKTYVEATVLDRQQRTIYVVVRVAELRSGLPARAPYRATTAGAP